MNHQKEHIRLYRTFGILSVTAVMWVTWNLIVSGNTPAVCLFRNVTGIPCPSCGITHSIMAIFHLNFNEALQENILGFAAVLLMIVVPLLLLVDLIKRSNHFISLYHWSEQKINSNLFVSLPLIIIVMINWIYLIARN